MIKADVEFTHPEKLSQHSCILYGVAITYLLNNSPISNQGVGKKAFELCYRLANTNLANWKTDYDKTT